MINANENKKSFLRKHCAQTEVIMHYFFRKAKILKRAYLPDYFLFARYLKHVIRKTNIIFITEPAAVVT